MTEEQIVKNGHANGILHRCSLNTRATFPSDVIVRKAANGGHDNPAMDMYVERF